MKQKIYKRVVSLLTVLLIANFVFISLPVLGAADTDNFWGGSKGRDYVTQNSGLPGQNAANNDPRLVVANIIRFILGFLGILAVIIVVYAGFKWMLSGGSEDKIGEAKKMLIAGVIGLIIILAAYIVVNFVINQLIGATTGVPVG